MSTFSFDPTRPSFVPDQSFDPDQRSKMANTTANLGQTDFLRISPARMDQAFQPPRINDMNEGEVQA